MEGAAENFNLSLRINGPLRDLLHKGPTQSNLTNGYEHGKVEDGEDLQLSLGLSMNGRFGVDPASKKLKRSSSSIPNLNFVIDNGGGTSINSQQTRGVASEIFAPLRTSSMPVKAGEEEEEEMRQRKELQSMRRMEARKKRMEKLKNVRVVNKENSCEDVSKNEIVSARRNVENGSVLLLPSSQGSIGSQRSGSSGFSDFDQSQQAAEGASHQNAEVKSPSSIRQLQTEQDPSTVRAAAAGADRSAAKRDSNKLLKNALVDMPYVTTKVGRGINRVEGFLYKYKKGDEVKIVCVCHGMFLSPAEFVKHGGGAEVENPLKHIVVSHSPLF